ncbi:MAG: hypothetical protein PHN88_14700 [Ignavibacteria bacterium]|nr:hypothetical protein [Ignavibacteria bacterium]
MNHINIKLTKYQINALKSFQEIVLKKQKEYLSTNIDKRVAILGQTIDGNLSINLYLVSHQAAININNVLCYDRSNNLQKE